MRFRYLEKSSTTAALHPWPARLVPPPRESTGAPNLRQTVTAATTSASSLGTTSPIEEVRTPEPVPATLEGSETILVVEDDDAVRKMACTFLTIKGYKVVEASNASDAIEIVTRDGKSIALLLTDVVMPGMKGRELVEQISKVCERLPVLYMSAYTEDAAVNSGILDRGTAFIEKPFGPDDLAAKIRELLGSNAMEQPSAN